MKKKIKPSLIDIQSEMEKANNSKDRLKNYLQNVDVFKKKKEGED
ncbi:hypothetical protein [Chondrinema litorale]|nr:hypothetical protein [Chondrinema litorale]UZR93731.1 hypothetical protein OQ292_17940 [Chondrinema litorale]